METTEQPDWSKRLKEAGDKLQKLERIIVGISTILVMIVETNETGGKDFRQITVRTNIYGHRGKLVGFFDKVPYDLPLGEEVQAAALLTEELAKDAEGMAVMYVYRGECLQRGGKDGKFIRAVAQVGFTKEKTDYARITE